MIGRLWATGRENVQCVRCEQMTVIIMELNKKQNVQRTMTVDRLGQSKGW